MQLASPRRSALFILLTSAVLVAGAGATCFADTPEPTPADTPPAVVEAVTVHRVESRIDSLEIEQLRADVAAAVASSARWERRSHALERERDSAIARSESLAVAAAEAPTAADSAVRFAAAYQACSSALGTAMLTCAAKDSALLDERLARWRADSIADVHRRGRQRADSTLAVAVSTPRGEGRCRIARVIPCPTRTEAAVGAAAFTAAVLKGWLRPPDLAIRW